MRRPRASLGYFNRTRKPPVPPRLRARAVKRAKELERLFSERFITPGREDREVLSYLTPKRASSFVTSIVRQLPREEWDQLDKHDFYEPLRP